MARRYEISELLWLRDSPLVTKPPSLPPIEEWMGSIPDPTQRKPRDNNSNNQNETTPRRPSLLETRHVSRVSNSDDIVLGPPKTAFASASRILNKSSVDASERLSRFQESDEAKNDRYNFRDKFFKDRDFGDKDFERRDGKPGILSNRRSDREDWNNGRPRRIFQDDTDRRPRRNGDTDRWEGKDGYRDRDSRDFNAERGPRDKEGRFVLRRDGPGRARHEGSWFRDGSAQDSPDVEEERPSVRNKEWRRDRVGVDRDWNRGTKIEQEPEWLDSSDRGDHRRAHTQEDFERWKERMKANSAQAQVEEKMEVLAETVAEPPPPQKPEVRPTDGSLFSDQGTPFQGGSTMDRFFGLLGDAKPSPDVITPGSVDSVTTKKDLMSAKPSKSSRFAGLFSPPPETSPARESASPALEVKYPADQSAAKDADQEGFQRILQMLGGGGKSRTTTPKVDASQQPRPPSRVHMEHTRTATAMSSPAVDPFHRPEFFALSQDNVVRGTAPLQETPLPQSVSKEPQARDREHLLRLMQQVRISPPQGNNSQGQPQSAGPAPGMMNMPELLSRPQGMPPTQKTANFLEDPAIANMQRPEVRRLPNGLPAGYLDEIPFPQGNQLPITPGGSRVPQNQNHAPLGLQRPPGFDNVPRPGWTGHQLPPQQGGGPSPLAPPPGIPTPTRGINPNFSSNMMPMQGGILPMNERQPFPRAGGNGSGFAPPPGMIPPGYMTMNVPLPSGFPPMPPNSDPMMGPGQGPYGGVNLGPQGLPPSSRHLLDMLGQANGGDIRGGMVAPGQFR